MKCPKCGSDKIQFGTNTHGKSFSFIDSCCGYILLGPLGLLCGVCGSGTSTEEFWICSECGYKFSNNEAKFTQQKAQLAQKAHESSVQKRYLQYKSEVNQALKAYGSEQVIRESAHLAYQKEQTAKDNFETEYQNFLNENQDKNRKIRRLLKSTKGYSNAIAYIVGSMIILGILCIDSGFGIPIFLIGIILAVLLELRAPIAKKRLYSLFRKASPENNQLFLEKQNAHSEYEKWIALRNKMDYCQEYEKQMHEK